MNFRYGAPFSNTSVHWKVPLARNERKSDPLYPQLNLLHGDSRSIG